MQKTSQPPVATAEDLEPPPPPEDIPQGNVAQPGVRKIVNSEGRRRSTKRRAKTETVKKVVNCCFNFYEVVSIDKVTNVFKFTYHFSSTF